MICSPGRTGRQRLPPRWLPATSPRGSPHPPCTRAGKASPPPPNHNAHCSHRRRTHRSPLSPPRPGCLFLPPCRPPKGCHSGRSALPLPTAVERGVAGVIPAGPISGLATLPPLLRRLAQGREGPLGRGEPGEWSPTCWSMGVREPRRLPLRHIAPHEGGRPMGGRSTAQRDKKHITAANPPMGPPGYGVPPPSCCGAAWHASTQSIQRCNAIQKGG